MAYLTLNFRRAESRIPQLAGAALVAAYIFFMAVPRVWGQSPVGQAVGQSAGAASWPQVTVGATRTYIAYAYDTIPPTLPQIYVVSSSDGGATFSSPVRVGVTEGSARRPAVAAGAASGNLHVVWSEVDFLLNSARLRYCQSTDGGQGKEFSSPSSIEEAGISLNPRIALDEQETPLLVWESGSTSIFERQIRFGRLAGATRNLSGTRNLSAVGPVSSPNILFQGGVLHVVWRQITERQATVFYTRSTDRGETWSAPAALPGTGTSSSPPDDFLPLLAAGGNSIGVLVRDATRDLDRILYIHSANRGLNFDNPVAVSGTTAPGPTTAGFLAPFSETAGRVAVMWVDAQTQGQGALPAVFASCTADPARFGETRSLIGLAGAVRSLSASADQTGRIHAAMIQTVDQSSKVIYLGTRCPPSLSAANVVNAGNQRAEGLAPGTLATAYGMDLGTSTGLGAQIDDKTGLVTTQLGPVTLTVDGIRAPLLFARRDQINFQVPLEVAGKPSVRIVVSVSGIESSSAEAPVLATGPAFFTLNGSGIGPVVAQNANGSLNLAENGATAESFVTLYATGQGLVNPRVGTGQLGPSAPPFPIPAGEVIVTIGGQRAELIFAGLAPFLLGVQQVNARIPAGLAAGAQPIQIQVGSRTSVNGTTIYLR